MSGAGCESYECPRRSSLFPIYLLLDSSDTIHARFFYLLSKGEYDREIASLLPTGTVLRLLLDKACPCTCMLGNLRNISFIPRLNTRFPSSSNSTISAIALLHVFIRFMLGVDLCLRTVSANSGRAYVLLAVRWDRTHVWGA